MRLVNLTPHAIVLQSADGTRTVVPPSGTIARVTSSPGAQETWADAPGVPPTPVPIFGKQDFGEVTGIPPRTDDETWRNPEALADARQTVVFIVSSMVLQALNREYLNNGRFVAPGKGPNDGAIRDGKGQIEAITRLVRG
jgi:hypothetical protein